MEIFTVLKIHTDGLERVRGGRGGKGDGERGKDIDLSETSVSCDSVLLIYKEAILFLKYML